jgi:hypothetical protein
MAARACCRARRPSTLARVADCAPPPTVATTAVDVRSSRRKSNLGSVRSKAHPSFRSRPHSRIRRDELLGRDRPIRRAAIWRNQAISLDRSSTPKSGGRTERRDRHPAAPSGRDVENGDCDLQRQSAIGLHEQRQTQPTNSRLRRPPCCLGPPHEACAVNGSPRLPNRSSPGFFADSTEQPSFHPLFHI